MLGERIEEEFVWRVRFGGKEEKGGYCSDEMA
jgi:hypothetical protein